MSKGCCSPSLNVGLKMDFSKQREKFPMPKDFQNRKKNWGKALPLRRNTAVKISKNSHECYILASKQRTIVRSTKTAWKVLNFTCITCLILFSLEFCWSAQNRKHVFFDQNSDYPIYVTKCRPQKYFCLKMKVWYFPNFWQNFVSIA